MIEQAELKRIYNNITSNKAYLSTLHRNDDAIKWVLIFGLDNSHREIGITQNGYWGVKSSDHFRIFNKETSLLYFIILLEYPIEDIKRKLILSLNDFIELQKINRVFPFGEIVKFVFEYNSSNYWVALAFEWFDQFTASEKQVLKESIDKIKNNYSLSQKVRQKAKKELKQL